MRSNPLTACPPSSNLPRPGVSRTVVREAMHQLKSQGLVRSRHGFGVFANAPPALAAQRVTRTQLAQLKRAMAAIDSATGAGELGVEEDLAFHRAIGEATGNPQFVRLLSIFEVYLRDAMTVTKGYESRRGAATQHHLNGERRLVTCGVLKPIKTARARR